MKHIARVTGKKAKFYVASTTAKQKLILKSVWFQWFKSKADALRAAKEWEGERA